MPTINAGSSQTFTAGVRDQLFTLTANGGALGTVTGAASASFGPGAERRAFGPFAVGQSITVTVQSGTVIVEYGDATPENEGAVGSVLNGVQTAAGATGVAGANDSNELVMLDGSLRITTPAYTWATLPAASAYIGNALVTDVGLHGSLWRSDGSTWGIVGGHCVLASTAMAAAAHTGTTAKTTIVSFTLKGGLLGLNGCFEVLTKWTTTNNANTKTHGLDFGGANLGGAGQSSVASFGVRQLVQNRGSASSQLGGNGVSSGFGGSGANTFATSSINSNIDQTIAISITLAVSTDSAVLDSYEIILRRP